MAREFKVHPFAMRDLLFYFAVLVAIAAIVVTILVAAGELGSSE